jgi:hypothetical protein
MDPTAPMTPRDFAHALWGLALGMGAPWVIIVPIWLLIERYRDRKASRYAQARLQAWEAAHPREAPDEHVRLAQIRDQLWLESLTPTSGPTSCANGSTRPSARSGLGHCGKPNTRRNGMDMTAQKDHR